MHTTTFNSCRIHHNGDYEGEIYISNKGTTEKPIGVIAEISLTVNELKTILKHTKNKPEVTIKTLSDKDCDPQITILTSDIELFFHNRLLTKIQEKLETQDIKFKTMKQIAELLRIK